ncbi:hypothetical protein [Lacisediminimonas profundi]|uniref:hypothetical protein n=1 Tax=Lacisediminimonas profundi TaxID=2603856 RepID=UPI00124B3274|nr:hypothetical protein [Lacisediminimonas profundi]
MAGAELLKSAIKGFSDWQKRRAEPVDPQASPQSQISTVAGRLETLERAEIAQAELVRNMAEQINALSVSHAELSRKLSLALAAAGVAILLSVVAIGVNLLR